MGAIAEGFVAFAQPLLDQTDGSQEQMQKAFTLSQLCFNLALLPEDQREESLNELRSDLEMNEEDFDAFRREVVGPMIRRHWEMFPLMHRQVGSRATFSPSEFVPRPVPALVQSTKKAPVTDRYAPCPCNSGRKFKFCCGAKGR